MSAKLVEMPKQVGEGHRLILGNRAASKHAGEVGCYGTDS